MCFVLKILVSHVNVTMATVTTFIVITIWSEVENRLNERGFSVLCMPHESCRVVIIISLQTHCYTTPMHICLVGPDLQTLENIPCMHFAAFAHLLLIKQNALKSIMYRESYNKITLKKLIRTGQAGRQSRN